jgi:TPR repeat protein
MRFGSVVVIAFALCACSSKDKLLERDCVEKAQGDACDQLASRYRAGEGVPRDRSRAEAFSTRARELFERGCARGDHASCLRLTP